MVDRKAGTCGFPCRLLVHSWTLVTSATGADEQQMSLLPASSNELASFLCRETPTKRDVASVSCALLGSFSSHLPTLLGFIKWSLIHSHVLFLSFSFLCFSSCDFDFVFRFILLNAFSLFVIVFYFVLQHVVLCF